ncbi:hypothetical protein WKW79_28910 [Variovorax robiniae]|uniref:Uncharacterized protein n=1 Tax=Variovorax robiniae TaxID=1836199 RepID=A0ABU8XFK8_9BURK
MVKSLMVGASGAFVLVLIGSLFAGGGDAIRAMFGRPTDNHFAYVAIALFSYLAGQLSVNGASSSGRFDADLLDTSRLQWLATVAFLAIYIWINRDMVQSQAQLVDGILRCAASLLVWAFVVLMPWAAIEKASAKERRP